MEHDTEILDIVSCPPGWFNIYLTRGEPGYFLSPIAVWAKVKVIGYDIRDQYEEDISDFIGLDGTHWITCPWVEGDGYYGTVHTSEITDFMRREWYFEAMFRESNQDLNLSQVPKENPPEFSGTPIKLAHIVHHAECLSDNTHVICRTPAFPGWFNVYLLTDEPWYLLRPIAIWALVRRREPRKFFLNALGKLCPHFLLWERFGLPCVEGVDGTLAPVYELA
ncbi:MAG: hypothetical protein WCO56_16860 [Verrucomicrobiota bacterium]